MKYAVGIDVGGTNTRVALINEEYKILERIKFSTDSKDPEVTLQKIGEIIKGYRRNWDFMPRTTRSDRRCCFNTSKPSWMALPPIKQTLRRDHRC